MSGAITILAVLLVGLGAVQTFTRDLWWVWVRFKYRMVGLTATRTMAWERWTTLSGGILLLLGILIYVFVPR